jgi:hypothetical protein
MGRRALFSLGWGKTGTTTLGVALQILGFNSEHGLPNARLWARGDLAPLIAKEPRYDAVKDRRGVLAYRELDAAFPGSRFVLTTRDPVDWLRSFRNEVATEVPSSERDEQRRIFFGAPIGDLSDDQLMERIARHNREVQDYFADRPNDLLVVDWTRGDGWPELCSFLGIEEPDVPFPHAKRGRYRLPRWLRWGARWIEGYRRANWGRLGRWTRRVLP